MEGADKLLSDGNPQHIEFVEFAMLMYSVDHRSEIIDKVKRFGAFGKMVKFFLRTG